MKIPVEFEDMVTERYELAKERLSEIKEETDVPKLYRDFFLKEAEFLSCLFSRREELLETEEESLDKLKEVNKKLYEDIMPENYDLSYGNPDFAAKVFGCEYGKILCWLYAELRGAISFAYENRQLDLTVAAELFLEIYGAFASDEIPSPSVLKGVIYYYNYDYCPDFAGDRIAEMVDPSRNFAYGIIMNSNLDDIRYLYKYGLYVSDNEIKTAEFLSSLSDEEIDSMARTYTEGYKKGFENSGKDLSIKKTVNIRYNLGFERMIKAAIGQFKKMGLDCVIYRVPSRSMDAWTPRRIGYDSTSANPQYDFDHKSDYGLYVDEKLITYKLQSMQNAYEGMKYLANTHAGPACVETFGEKTFMPISKDTCISLNEKQQQMMVHYSSESGQITKRFIIGEERSFTIIAYPIPDIGPDFEEIFRETVKINTLDYMTYQNIQQKLIDALDQGEKVHIKGKDGNETDLYVSLWDIDDPSRQTKFENCVADVNIPVGEVFTSPRLKGTNGVLHVKKVYLEGLNYIDLKITLRDGMVESYSCANFDTEEKNKKYIEDNIMFLHPTLPIGEFAIGTNTTAYEMGRRFGIEDKMPILIYEKTGPHFAFGDTCFSWSEDLHTYNPDGKEIMAKENEVSALRKTDVSKAYFGCHTDITIPYDELGYIKAVRKDGSEISIIEDGMFSLAGCELLNEPLKK